MAHQETDWGGGGYQTNEPTATTTASPMDGEEHVLASLYEALDQEPSSVHIRELLLEVWKDLGDEGNEALLYSFLPPSMSSG